MSIMKLNNLPIDESIRLATLLGTNALSGAYDYISDVVLNLGKAFFKYPFSTVSFLEEGNEVRTAFYGTKNSQVERGVSVAAEIIESEEGWLVANSTDTTPRSQRAIQLLGLEYSEVKYIIGSVIKATNGERIGAFYLADSVNHQFDDNHLVIVRHLSSIIEHEIALNACVMADDILGLPNKKGLSFISNYLLAHADRQGEPVGLIKVTIEGVLGKEVSREEFLLKVADIMSSQARGGDVVSYFGDTEFVMLLPDTDRQGVEQVMNKLNGILQNMLNESLTDTQGCTIGIGGSCCEPHGDPLVLNEMLFRANKDFPGVKTDMSDSGVQNKALLTGPVAIVQPND